MSAENTVQNLTGTCWRDEAWLAAYPLNRATVLDYFALSPFYDRNCNNEIARQQGLPLSKLETLPPGTEYLIQDTQEPHLFVIKRQHRASSKAATPHAFYYVLDGLVYQAPTLHAALSSRMQRCLFNLQAAFGRLQSDLDPLLLAEKKSAAAPEAKPPPPPPPPSIPTKEALQQREKVDSIIRSVLRHYPMPAFGAQPQSQVPQSVSGAVSLSSGGAAQAAPGATPSGDDETTMQS